ncbi:MAG TPA: LysE family translocator [Burkholderiales bacterium]
MLGTQDLLLFVLSALLLNITPGPDTLYIVGRSSTQGLKAGVIAALGISAGIMVHVTAAALGLSAIFTASATAFAVLKLAGAAYLVYVGISLLRTRVVETRAPERAALRTVFIQGFWTNVLNPKVALFFLAFLPQFVDLDAPGKVIPLLFLGLLFNVNGTLWNLFVAWSSARVGRAVLAHGPAATWFNRSVGALFIYLGVRLALTRE